jgi:carbon storage regulator CsrA
VVVADEGNSDVARQEDGTGHQAANAGCRRGLMEGFSMLVLERKKGQQIVIGDSILFEDTQIKGSRVRLALHAPRDVRILRSELEKHDEMLEGRGDR